MINRYKSKIAKDDHLKELVKGSAITFALKILGMALGYIAIFLISKKNGAEGVGFYSLINQSLMLLGILATWGTGVSVLRYVGQFNTDEERPQLKHIYRTLIKITVPISICLGVITFFMAPFVAEHMLKNTSYTPALKLVGAALPFFAINSVGIEFIRGLKQLKTSEFIRSVSRPAVIILFVLLFWGGELPNVYIIYFLIGALILNTVLSSGIVLMRLKAISKQSIRKISTRTAFQVSTPMMISGLTAAFMSSLPLFFISYFHSTPEVGVFSIAFRISLLISIVLTVVNTIAAPKFSHLFWSKKNDELQRVIDQSSKMMFFGAILLSSLVVLFSPFILSVFGDEFGAGQTALIVLVGGQLFNAFTGSVGLFLNMSGNQKVLRNAGLVSFILQISIAFLLIPEMGVLGAAITSALSGVIWNFICILYVHTKLGFRTYYSPFSK